jgi:hypothetical protein
MSCALNNYASGEKGLEFQGIKALFTPHLITHVAL